MKITDWLTPIHRKFRGEKIRLFFNEMHPHPSDTLLDAGGGSGISGEFLEFYSYFRKVTILNKQPSKFDPKIRTTLQEIIADGCFMPVSANTYDWVFSNAVIEHVGNANASKCL